MQMMFSVRAALASLPKVELHRHLEGSLRLATLSDLARLNDIGVSCNIEELRRYVQVSQVNANSRAFLDTFAILRRFYLSPDIIRRFTREAVEDALKDNIRYLELRFTPAALGSARSYPLHEVAEWVVDEVQKARLNFPDVQVALIASVNRHESLAIAEQVLRIAVDHRDDIVGIDLAGDEVTCAAEPFIGLFHEARCEGLGVSIHAGEWTGAAAVRQAVEEFGASRIGHGIRVVDDPELIALSRDRGVTFEVCPTSNVRSGAITCFSDHPLSTMLAAGLKVTLNTDDPAIFDISLTDELAISMDRFGLTLGEIKDIMVVAAESTFQTPAARASLVETFREAFSDARWS